MLGGVGLTPLTKAMKAEHIPIKSTWRDAIGIKLTDRRITNRIKQGWYGRIAQLKLEARSADKAKRAKAKEQLKRFGELELKAKPHRTFAGKATNIEEFC